VPDVEAPASTILIDGTVPIPTPTETVEQDPEI
jgi:hypothetical protein